MYYELIDEAWEPNNSKSALFNGSTYPIEIVPVDFWNADRMPAAENPEYDTATHKRVGPKEVGGGTVGYVVVEKTAEDLIVSIPTIVSKMQAYIYLSRIGRFVEIRDRCYTLSAEAKIAFDTASEFDRTHPLVQAMGLTEEDLDTMFRGASEI